MRAAATAAANGQAQEHAGDGCQQVAGEHPRQARAQVPAELAGLRQLHGGVQHFAGAGVIDGDLFDFDIAARFVQDGGLAFIGHGVSPRWDSMQEVCDSL